MSNYELRNYFITQHSTQSPFVILKEVRLRNLLLQTRPTQKSPSYCNSEFKIVDFIIYQMKKRRLNDIQDHSPTWLRLL
jgi:hypothetical protein